MYLKIEESGRNLIVSLKGELDHHSSEATRNKIDREFLDKNSINIIINLRDVSFMDSSGIGLIMGRYQNVKSKNGKLIVANDNKYIDRILKMSGLLKIIDYYPSVEIALNNL